MFPLKNTGNAEGSSFAFPLTRRGVFRSGFRPRLLTVSGNVADVTCPLDWKCQESAFIQRTNNSNLKRDEPLEAESMTRCIRQLQFGGYFFFFLAVWWLFLFFWIFFTIATDEDSAVLPLTVRVPIPSRESTSFYSDDVVSRWRNQSPRMTSTGSNLWFIFK